MARAHKTTLPAGVFAFDNEVGTAGSAMIADSLAYAGVDVSPGDVLAAAMRVPGAYRDPHFGTVRFAKLTPGTRAAQAMIPVLMDWVDDNVVRADRPRAWSAIIGHMRVRFGQRNTTIPRDATLRARAIRA